MAGNSSSKEGGGNAPLSIDSGVIGGSTGGAGDADLARGFSHVSSDSQGLAGDPALAGTVSDSYEPTDPPPREGFLGRPKGWQR